jgi:hypothetical protein
MCRLVAAAVADVAKASRCDGDVTCLTFLSRLSAEVFQLDLRKDPGSFSGLSARGRAGPAHLYGPFNAHSVAFLLFRPGRRGNSARQPRNASTAKKMAKKTAKITAKKIVKRTVERTVMKLRFAAGRCTAVRYAWQPCIRYSRQVAWTHRLCVCLRRGLPAIDPTAQQLVRDRRHPHAGYERVQLQSRLRSQGYGVPFIFITAVPDENVRWQALNDGALCFLTKPFGEDVLVDCLNTAVEQRRSGING